MDVQKQDWLTQLESTARESPDKDERDAAEMLLKAHQIELERMNRIKSLAYKLLFDYQFTSPPVLLGGDFIYAKY